MAFSTAFIVPANTGKDNPASYTFVISPMRINSIDITFPDGCVGLVECWFEYQTIQIFPYNRDGCFIGNGQTIRIQPMVDLLEPPWELIIKATNNDDTFDHTLYVIVDASFIDKKGNIGANIIEALASLFAMKGR